MRLFVYVVYLSQKEQVMRITFLPKTTLGRWSLWVLLLFVSLRIIRTVMPDYIQLDPDFTVWTFVLWPFQLVFAVGWVAGILAWIAIIWQKERAVVTFFAALVAVLITLLETLILS